MMLRVRLPQRGPWFHDQPVYDEPPAFHHAHDDDDSPAMTALRLLVGPDSPPRRHLGVDWGRRAQHAWEDLPPTRVPPQQSSDTRLDWNAAMCALQPYSSLGHQRSLPHAGGAVGLNHAPVPWLPSGGDPDWPTLAQSGWGAKRPRCEAVSAPLHGPGDVDLAEFGHRVRAVKQRPASRSPSHSNKSEFSHREAMQLVASDGTSTPTRGAVPPKEPFSRETWVLHGQRGDAAPWPVHRAPDTAAWLRPKLEDDDAAPGAGASMPAAPATDSAGSGKEASAKGCFTRTRVKGANSTSTYRGVTRHRQTGRYEAQLWDSTAVLQKKGINGRSRGRQIYLGGYACEEAAAKAYDRAAIKFFGWHARLNFNPEDYDDDEPRRSEMSREEWVAYLRSLSDAYARTKSRLAAAAKHLQSSGAAEASG